MVFGAVTLRAWGLRPGRWDRGRGAVSFGWALACHGPAAFAVFETLDCSDELLCSWA